MIPRTMTAGEDTTSSRSAHDGRYAPSPTGELHLGNLRTALAAWLVARSAGARFLLRIDDLDPERVRPGIADAQLADLAALGIDWDGEPVFQRARLERYALALHKLAADGATYPCFCSRADIRAAASAPHGELPGDAYPGTCALLAPGEAAARIAADEPHCLRVRAHGARSEIHDRLLGRVDVVVDDFVVRRKDGVPAYNLATVLDDHDMGVGEVVRGADLATSAPRQAWLAARLGLRVPTFSHVPLVLGPDGARLAKRHGGISLATLAAEGIDARHVRAALLCSLGVVDEDLTAFDPRCLAGPDLTWRGGLRLEPIPPETESGSSRGRPL